MLFANPWLAATILPLWLGCQWMSQNAEISFNPMAQKLNILSPHQEQAWTGQHPVETNSSIMLFALPPCYIHAKSFIITSHSLIAYHNSIAATPTCPPATTTINNNNTTNTTTTTSIVVFFVFFFFFGLFGLFFPSFSWSWSSWSWYTHEHTHGRVLRAIL